MTRRRVDLAAFENQFRPIALYPTRQGRESPKTCSSAIHHPPPTFWTLTVALFIAHVRVRLCARIQLCPGRAECEACWGLYTSSTTIPRPIDATRYAASSPSFAEDAVRTVESEGEATEKDGSTHDTATAPEIRSFTSCARRTSDKRRILTSFMNVLLMVVYLLPVSQQHVSSCSPSIPPCGTVTE